MTMAVWLLQQVYKLFLKWTTIVAHVFHLQNSHLYVQKIEKKKLKFRVEFGLNLRRIRDEKGLSQQKLSNLADVSKTFLGEIERGQSLPSIETVRAISEALEIEISELFNFEY